MSVPYRYVDPEKPWKNRYFTGCRAEKLQHPVILGGKRAAEPESLDQIKDRVKEQLNTEIWEEEQRFVNPHRHYMDMTPDYYEMKMSLLHDSRE